MENIGFVHCSLHKLGLMQVTTYLDIFYLPLKKVTGGKKVRELTSSRGLNVRATVVKKL